MTLDRGAVAGCHFRFVRSGDEGATFLCRLADETETLADLTARSGKRGAKLTPDGDRVQVTPQ